MKSSMLLAMSVAAALALGLPLATQAKTIVVPSGSILTIQDGVDAAEPGDTIKVLPGTYEGVIVTTPSVKLKAESKTGPVKVEPSGGAIGVLIMADDVEIVGFEVVTWGPLALAVVGNRVHVANNFVSNSGYPATIAVASSSGTRIDHNKVLGGEIAIAVWNSSGTHINHNEVGGSKGIVVSTCSDTRVDDNDIVAGESQAIHVYDSPGTRLSHNTIDCSDGILIESTEVLIDRNIIHIRAGGIGIWVYASSCGNVFMGNSAHGVSSLDFDLFSQEDPAAPCNIYRNNDSGTAAPSLAFWDVKVTPVS